jgi:hypothetical protein
MRSKEDDRLRLRLENKLSNQGLRAPCRLSVEVYQNMATITGNVLYEYQKRAAIQAARTLDGISAVVDRIKVEAGVKKWDDDPHAAPYKPPEDSIDPMQGTTDSADRPIE